MKNVGQRWRKTGKVFTWEDREVLQRQYAEKHPRVSAIRQIGAEGLSRIKQTAKEQGVTVNKYGF